MPTLARSWGRCDCRHPGPGRPGRAQHHCRTATTRPACPTGSGRFCGPLLPAPRSGPRGDRPEKWDRRLVLDAIFYLLRSGIAWRALPHDFPPHPAVHGTFRRWSRTKAWRQVYALLGDRARTPADRDARPSAAATDFFDAGRS